MKKNVVKRFVAFGLSVLMISGITGCGSADLKPGQDGGDVTQKPDSIKLMADTILTEENGLDDFEDAYEQMTGIELVIEKPDHAKYYEKVTLSFAAEQPADILEVGSTYYPELANSQALWNMTEAWDTDTTGDDNWKYKNAVKAIIDEQYVDALRMNVNVPTYDENGDAITDALGAEVTEYKEGQLYGFPMAAGNGTITYVRSDWLEQLGLDFPKNYDEFINMLQQFKENEGVGAIPEGVIPITAAGLLNTETPYDIYLREFYQDAIPDFYQDPETGKYIDGFAQPEMAEAITRLRDAYSKGLIDSEIVTNKTSTCRDKVGAGKVGAFNYWAGMWSKKLNQSLNKGELVAMPSIEEMVSLGNDGEWRKGYTERVPTAFAMSVYAQNKNAILEIFLMFSHDGGEGQLLFTRGVEKDYPIYKKDENGNITDEVERVIPGHYEWTDKENGIAAALPYYSNEKTKVEKAMYAPELTITDWNDPVKPVTEDEIDDENAVQTSLATFRQDRVFATVPIVTDVVAENLADLNVVRNEVVAAAVKGQITVEEAMQQYLEEGRPYYEEILNDLNKDAE